MTDIFKIDGIQCQVKRTGRTSLGISIERDGSVIVNAPQDVDSTAIEKFVSSKRLWIHQKLTYKKETNKEKIRRDFVNGQGFLYLGKSYRLRLIKYGANTADKKAKDSCCLRFNHGYFELSASEQFRAREHFVNWYKNKTEEQLKARLPRYVGRIGAEVKGFRVLDLGNRWASCGAKGMLNFNWRTVMAPIWVFDYILVHELAHMIQKGHTKKFWGIVARVISDYQEHEAWLQDHGVELDI
jgi:predicted metal-dependent hydrolase